MLYVCICNGLMGTLLKYATVEWFPIVSTFCQFWIPPVPILQAHLCHYKSGPIKTLKAIIKSNIVWCSDRLSFDLILHLHRLLYIISANGWFRSFQCFPCWSLPPIMYHLSNKSARLTAAVWDVCYQTLKDTHFKDKKLETRLVDCSILMNWSI